MIGTDQLERVGYCSKYEAVARRLSIPAMDDYEHKTGMRLGGRIGLERKVLNSEQHKPKKDKAWTLTYMLAGRYKTKEQWNSEISKGCVMKESVKYGMDCGAIKRYEGNGPAYGSYERALSAARAMLLDEDAGFSLKGLLKAKEVLAKQRINYFKGEYINGEKVKGKREIDKGVFDYVHKLMDARINYSASEQNGKFGDYLMGRGIGNREFYVSESAMGIVPSKSFGYVKSNIPEYQKDEENKYKDGKHGLKNIYDGLKQGAKSLSSKIYGLFSGLGR